MTNILRALKEKVDEVQEQMHKVGKEIETLIKNKEMLEIKDTVTENQQCLR